MQPQKYPVAVCCKLHMYKYAAAPTTDRERGEKEGEREGGKGSTKKGRGDVGRVDNALWEDD